MASSSNPRDPSKRVVLGMHVTVIAEDHERRPRQCEAMTRVVNAHGGLRRIETEPHPGAAVRQTRSTRNFLSIDGVR